MKLLLLACVLGGLGGLGGLAAAQAAPAGFHRAVGTLSRLLLVQKKDADTYLVSENIRVHFDAATPGILVSKTSIPLGDQGIFIATKLIPSWCGLDTEYLHVKYLTEQMAQSARLKRQVEAGTAPTSLVRARMGRCEVQTFSNSLESFVLLKQVPGALVWPPKQIGGPQ